jgi:hypothetical protein
MDSDNPVEVRALDGVSLAIGEGEFVTIMAGRAPVNPR